jgi:hypothetical protein
MPSTPTGPTLNTQDVRQMLLAPGSDRLTTINNRSPRGRRAALRPGRHPQQPTRRDRRARAAGELSDGSIALAGTEQVLAGAHREDRHGPTDTSADLVDLRRKCVPGPREPAIRNLLVDGDRVALSSILLTPPVRGEVGPTPWLLIKGVRGARTTGR